MRLAVSRTPRARGRINRLIVSMIMSTGISRVGVPSGSRWPSACVGWFRIPIIIVASHKGTANAVLRDSCVVGVKVYGRRPSRLSVIKNTIREARRRAHLWPPTFRGWKICCVKLLINQLCRVNRRQLSHRTVGLGKRTQGSANAKAARGMPRKTGLINWSKKLSAMVRIRFQF